MWEFMKEGQLEEEMMLRAEAVRRKVKVGKGIIDDSSDNDDFKACLDGADECAGLAVRRRQLDAERNADDSKDFIWDVRGGKWCEEHTGLPYDTYWGVASTEDAETFCLIYRLPKSFSMAISKYNEQDCLDLSKAWVHRILWWFEVWVAHGMNPRYEFKRSDGDGYVEHAALARLSAREDTDLAKRIRQIRGVAPRPMR